MCDTKPPAYRYLLVVDFEANCQEDRVITPQEITEVPVVPIDLLTQTIMEEDVFHSYCAITQPLTAFATDLTGITADMCAAGAPWRDVLNDLEKWRLARGFTSKNALLVTAGNWDFRTAFPKQCAYSGVCPDAFYGAWCNMAVAYKACMGVKGRDMPAMLESLGLPMVGRHHSGIDDARNIAAMCLALLRRGATFEITERITRKCG